MSAYNAESYLAQAMESILAQTFSDWELLIINDGSTDQSAAIINAYRDPRLKLINNPRNIGLTKSLNIGLHAAQTPYIARLDTDDISLPERLAKQYQFMENHPEVWLVATLTKLIDPESKTFDYQKTPTDPDLLRFSLLLGNSITHSSIFFRRQPILDLGGYNENFRYAQDFELYSRILAKGQIAVLPEVLVKYRRHEQSITLHQDSRQNAEDFAMQTVFNNLHRYTAATPQDFEALKQSLLIKRGRVGFRQALRAMQIMRQLWQSYLTKEKISPMIIKKIRPLYYRYQKNIIKRLLR